MLHFCIENRSQYILSKAPQISDCRPKQMLSGAPTYGECPLGKNIVIYIIISYIAVYFKNILKKTNRLTVDGVPEG